MVFKATSTKLKKHLEIWGLRGWDSSDYLQKPQNTNSEIRNPLNFLLTFESKSKK